MTSEDIKHQLIIQNHGLMTLSLTINENIKMALVAAHLNAGHSGGDSVAIGIYSPASSTTSILPSPPPPPPPPPPPFSAPSLISLMVSVDVKHHVCLLIQNHMLMCAVSLLESRE